MDPLTIQDRISRGMGSAARLTGEEYDLFRPRGPERPLASENRVMRLPVAFDGGYPGYRRPRGYERALRATFDSVAVQVGDYMRGPRGILFVAALPLMLRPLCVLTTAVLDLLRPAGAGAAGLSAYGGVTEDVLAPVLSGWPAQMLSEGAVGRGALPTDGGQVSWSVLLPPTPAAIEGSDLVQDAMTGRRYVVRSAEPSELGWRLLVRQTGV
jgi:hypothetical protein